MEKKRDSKPTNYESSTTLITKKSVIERKRIKPTLALSKSLNPKHSTKKSHKSRKKKPHL